MTEDFQTVSSDELALATGGAAGQIAQKVGEIGGKIQKIAGVVQNVIGAFKGLGAQKQPQASCPSGNCGG